MFFIDVENDFPTAHSTGLTSFDLEKIYNDHIKNGAEADYLEISFLESIYVFEYLIQRGKLFDWYGEPVKYPKLYFLAALNKSGSFRAPEGTF